MIFFLIIRNHTINIYIRFVFCPETTKTFAGLFVFSGAASAQKSHKNARKSASQHELSLTGGGGIGTLRYNASSKQTG